MSNDVFNLLDLITAILIGIAIGIFIGAFAVARTVDKYDKFCPECGHQYMAEVEYCSEDGSELREVR